MPSSISALKTCSNFDSPSCASFLGLFSTFPICPFVCTLVTDGNSQKNHNNQPKVVDDICTQLRAGNRNITGVMIESHINAGRQDVPAEGPSALKHGISITDACVDWETTVGMLDRLNEVCILSDDPSFAIRVSFFVPCLLTVPFITLEQRLIRLHRPFMSARRCSSMQASGSRRASATACRG